MNCAVLTALPAYSLRAALRERPPAALATGSGAASRSTMGTGVVFGITIATVIGLFLIPVCYVFIQRIIERGGKKAPAPAAASEAVNAGH